MPDETPYSIEYTENARKDLKKLDKSVALDILSKLKRLAENADVLLHKSLQGNWAGFYRLRSGDYRAIYGLDRENRLITVEFVGHRRDIYE